MEWASSSVLTYGVCVCCSREFETLFCDFIPAEESYFSIMSETDELAAKLSRRQALNEDEEMPRRQMKVFNPYTEFKEFTRKQIKDFEKMFKT